MSSQPRRARRLRASLLLPSRAMSRLRYWTPDPRVALVGLGALAVLLVSGTIRYGIEWFPSAAQVLPLLAGGLLLGRRAMRVLIVVVAMSLLAERLLLADGVRPGVLVVVGVTALLALEFARSREETGLGGLRGDSMLAELRQRLEQQGRLPPMPGGWQAEAVVRPAGGSPFAGDFVVSALTGDDARQIELALVDVSGKGAEAGTRALLLSGALGGLLGSKAPEDFLPAANAYLVRQDWDEGFATAVHLSADFATGHYAVTSAGHPPVAHFDAGSGRWSLTDASGVALGLLPQVSYTAVRGRLDAGDALLLYTDGLVEIPGRDLSVGIDKLLGEAERLVPQGFRGGAATLVNRVAGASPDDRGLVLLWRST